MLIWPSPRPAVKAALGVLDVAFGTVPVDTRTPRVRPEKFVKVSRVGGGMDNPVTDIARILVECWAKTDAVAEAMSGTAISALRNAGGTQVDDMFIRYFGNIDGPVQYDEPDIDMVRWQFHGDLYVSTQTLTG